MTKRSEGPKKQDSKRRRRQGSGPEDRAHGGVEQTHTSPLAAERSLFEIQTILDEMDFGSLQEAQQFLNQLMESGRQRELARELKQDDPEWLAQNMVYDALESEDPAEVVPLLLKAIDLDPECTDALVLLITAMGAPPEHQANMLRRVVERARAKLGEEFFEENRGAFWGIVSTRPYMRAVQTLAELLQATGQTEQATQAYEHMLELNPEDNQGARYPLLGLYLAEDRLEAARHLMERYAEEDVSATFAWGRVMERWLAGELGEAGPALSKARQVNAHVEAYLTGEKPLPEGLPAYYRPGDDNEARVCALELGLAWSRHPGFAAWVRQAA